MNTASLLTVKSVAERLGLSKQYIYQLIWQKRIETIKIDGITFVVPREDGTVRIEERS